MSVRRNASKKHRTRGIGFLSRSRRRAMVVNDEDKEGVRFRRYKKRVSKITDNSIGQHGYDDAITKMLIEEDFTPDDIDEVATNFENRSATGVRVVIGNQEWVFSTDSEADEFHKELTEQLWDDLGINSFAKFAQEHIKDEFIDYTALEDMMREGEYNHIYEMEFEDMADYDYFSDKLKGEVIDHIRNKLDDGEIEQLMDDIGVLRLEDIVLQDDIDTIEQYTPTIKQDTTQEVADNIDMSERMDEVKESYDPEGGYAGVRAWYDSAGGDVDEWINQNPQYVDMKGVSEYVAKTDGRGAMISGHDGNEHEYKGIYYYRIH